MLGTVLGIGVGLAILGGTWAASNLADGLVSTGAMSLGVLGALMAGFFIAIIGNTGHPEPE